MPTRLESELSQRLRELANQPGPPSLADRALVGARRTRRLRVVLAAAGALALAGAIAGTVLANFGPPQGISVGAPNGGCKTATDESVPQTGVPPADWPEFVTIVVDKLPPRSDYTLQSAYGVCTLPDAPNGPRPSAYAVINLGPSRASGHLTVDLFYGAANTPTSCASLPTPTEQVLFCDDATATEPMVFGVDQGDLKIVTAVYPDARTISIGSNGTPLDAEALRTVVADPDLAGLLS
jgi:hypothetical protein